MSRFELYPIHSQGCARESTVTCHFYLYPEYINTNDGHKSALNYIEPVVVLETRYNRNRKPTN